MVRSSLTKYSANSTIPAMTTINKILLNTTPRCWEGSVLIAGLEDCGCLELDFCTDDTPFWDEKLPHNDAN